MAQPNPLGLSIDVGVGLSRVNSFSSASSGSATGSPPGTVSSATIQLTAPTVVAQSLSEQLSWNLNENITMQKLGNGSYATTYGLSKKNGQPYTIDGLAVVAKIFHHSNIATSFGFKSTLENGFYEDKPTTLNNNEEQALKKLGGVTGPKLFAVIESSDTGDLNTLPKTILMSKVDGKTLKSTSLDSRGSVDSQKVFVKKTIRSAIEKLQAMHDLGVSHNDIKPDNILVDHDGNVGIIDFGLATPTSLPAGFGNGTHKFGVDAFMKEELSAFQNDLHAVGESIAHWVKSPEAGASPRIVQDPLFEDFLTRLVVDDDPDDSNNVEESKKPSPRLSQFESFEEVMNHPYLNDAS